MASDAAGSPQAGRGSGAAPERPASPGSGPLSRLAGWLVGPRGRPLLLSALALALALSAGAAMAAWAGFPAVVRSLRHFQPAWVAAIVGGRATCYLGYTLAYRATMRLRGGPRLSLGRSLSLVSAGFGAFVVGGGFAIDRRALRRLGASAKQARVRVLGLGALEYLGLAPLAWACALVLLGAAGVEWGLTLPWALGVPLGTAAAVALCLRRQSMTGRSRLHGAARDGVAALHLIGELGALRRSHLGAWLGMALYWAGELLSTWAGLRLFGLHLSFPRLVLAYATGYAVTPRGLPLAGVGVTEVLMPLAYTWVGLPLAPAVLAVVGYRVVALVIALPPALVAHRRLEQLAAPHRTQAPWLGGEVGLRAVAAR